MQWPFTGRDAQFAAARAALQRPDDSGLGLVGDAGVGKTRLAREVLAAAEAWHHPTAWAAATKSTASISFGAFAHLMPGHDPAAPADVNLLQAASRAIAARGANGRLVLGVDDAHQLDDASAALMHLLVTTASCFVVFTVRAGETMPDAVSRLLSGSDVTRIDMGNLAREGTNQLVRSALGGPVDAFTLQQLWRLSHGNPLLLHEIVLGAIDTGALTQANGLWRHTGKLAASRRLEQVVEARLEALAPDERDVLELLAVGEPLGMALLARLATPGSLERLERSGLIEITEDNLREQARLTHRLHADFLSAALPRTRARAIYRQLADSLAAVGARRREDLLQLAVWRLEAGGPVDADLLARAALRAHAAFDQHLAERLARAAIDAEDGFEARLVLGRALSGQHQTDDAEAVLAETETTAETDEELARAALARAANLGFGAREHTEALAVLRRASDEVDQPDWRDELSASQAALLADRGDFSASLAVAEKVEERPVTNDRALVTTLKVTTLGQALAGQIDGALANVERGLELAPRVRDELPYAETQLQLGRVHALTLHGQLRRAERLARDGHRRMVEAGMVDLAVAWGVLLSYVLVERGRPSAACRQLVEAAPHLRAGDPFGLAAGALVLQAYAEALLGRTDTADTLLDEHDARFGCSGHRFSAWVARARCWRAAQRDDLPSAIAAAKRAAASAGESGLATWEVVLLHDVVRLGRPAEVVEALPPLATAVDGKLVPAMVAHALALTSDDPQALEEVAATFEALGADLLAAEASAQAAGAHERSGGPNRARQARAHADMVARRCEAAVTPALGTHPPKLTPREREVTRLAADGRANRDIADDLGIATRTVENHLYAAYRKLRVSGREELASVL